LILQHIKKIKKKLAISLGYCSKYISSIKKREKREKQKKIVQKDVYWILSQKTKQEKIGSNQLGSSSNFII